MKTTGRTIAVVLMAFAGASLAAGGTPSQASLARQARITKRQAEKIALGGVSHGKIISGELEREHGLPIWSFAIATPRTKNITEVWVDARTGAIASLNVETPADQAKEASTGKR